MNRLSQPSIVASYGSRGGSPLTDWTDWLDAVYGPFVRGVGEFWTRALDPSAWTRRERCGRCGQERDQRCGRCGQERDQRCDPCACSICDADLAVMAYPGELRLLPITIENTRARERTITAEVSPWSSSRGDQIDWPTKVTPNQFVLAPCSQQTIMVRVLVGGERPAVATDHPELSNKKEDLADLTLGKVPSQVDVAACTVFYADLRLAGCDLRSIRLAVAVLPQACGAYRARCGCGCGS